MIGCWPHYCHKIKRLGTTHLPGTFSRAQLNVSRVKGGRGYAVSKSTQNVPSFVQRTEPVRLQSFHTERPCAAVSLAIDLVDQAAQQ